MSESRLPEDIVRISTLPPMMEKLIQQVHHPDEIDEAVRNLKIPASLLNFHLATPIDLSSVGLGQAVHIPVQITGREGGRKSLYYLNAGEETLEGIYVTNQGIALQFIKRVTGKILPAQTGDTYAQRITSREGEQISWSEENLEVLDHSRGIGNLSLSPSSLSVSPRIFGRNVSILFSQATVKSRDIPDLSSQ